MMAATEGQREPEDSGNVTNDQHGLYQPLISAWLSNCAHFMAHTQHFECFTDSRCPEIFADTMPTNETLVNHYSICHCRVD